MRVDHSLWRDTRGGNKVRPGPLPESPRERRQLATSTVGEKELSMRSLGKAVRLAAVATVVAASVGQSQAATGVALGYTDVAAVLGIGGVGGASFALGGRFEKIIKPLPDLGGGLLGIQVGVDWWSWNQNFGVGNSSSVSWIPIGVTGNYHFKIEEKKYDFFVGAGLGYQIVNATCVYQGVDYCGGAYSSGIYFITKAGARYFFSPTMAAYADLGVGAATLNIGLAWRMKAGS